MNTTEENKCCLIKFFIKFFLCQNNNIVSNNSFDENNIENNQQYELNLSKDELNKFITNFNNILAIIINSIESLNIYIKKDDLKDDLFLKKSLTNQLIACELMKVSINKLTLESNNIQPKKEKVNIIDLIHKVNEMMSILFDSNNVQYLIDIDKKFDNSKNYISDLSWLLSILLTFLMNAKKFTSNGFITTKLEVFDNYIRINIIDTGCGVKKEEIPNLFIKNKQKNNNLYLISKMCEKMLCNFGYKSNVFNNNSGSIFWIDIPTITSSITKESFIPNEISNKMKVIICDDSNVMIEIFNNYLNKQIPNATVYSTNCISELLETFDLIDSNDIIIIILDILLQNDNALHHLNDIKNKNFNVGIIIHTGSSMNDDEILKYNRTTKLPLVIMHKPASLEIIKKNTTLILEKMGCFNIFVISNNLNFTLIIKKFYENKYFPIFNIDNIIDARKILFTFNGFPLIIFISKSILDICSNEIKEEFNFINSFKCIIIENDDNDYNDEIFIFDHKIHKINDIILNNILTNSINKFSNR
jgi:hypothetical protein